MSRILAIWVVCFTAAGCGSLRVDLSVLDPDYIESVQEQALLRVHLREALFETNADIVGRYDTLQSAHRLAVDEISQAYTEEAKNRSGNDETFLLEIAASQLPDFEEFIVPKYDETLRSVNQLNGEIRAQFQGLDVAKINSKFLVEGRLAVLLNQKRSLVQSFKQEVTRDMDGTLDEFEDVVKRDVKPVIVAANALHATSKRLFVEQLWGSPLAYAIASAPKDAWDAKLNKAYGMGQLGNMNVAIKLGKEDEVFGREFTVKGLTFDPSNVASVASKVTAQSLLLAAQIAGVPLASTTTDASAGTDALGARSTALNQTQAKQALRQATFDDAKDALLLIARVLLSEADKMSKENSAEVRADAIRAFTATYDAHKARLDVSQTQ